MRTMQVCALLLSVLVSLHLYADHSSDEGPLTAQNEDYAGLCIAINYFCELTSLYRL